MSREPLYNVKDIAECLNIDTSTVYLYLKELNINPVVTILSKLHKVRHYSASQVKQHKVSKRNGTRTN